MDHILQALLESYHNFRISGALSKKASLLTSLGQNPGSMMISCVDSRVEPSMIFDLLPGEMLAVRNVANLVPPYEDDEGYHGVSASLEFGVCILRVRHLIILGHSQCGGVGHFLHEDGATPPTDTSQRFISKWVSLLNPLKNQVQTHLHGVAPSKRLLLCSQMAVLVSLKNLLTFPWIASAVDRSLLTLHGWFFDIPTQTVFYYDDKVHGFLPLSDHVRGVSPQELKKDFPMSLNKSLA